MPVIRLLGETRGDRRPNDLATRVVASPGLNGGFGEPDAISLLADWRRTEVARGLKVGDVFTVPLADGRTGFGQVVATYGKDAYFFALFDLVVPLDEAADRVVDALAAPVLFLALSMDAKLHVGHWTLMGNRPVDAAIPLPAYKEAVGMPPRYDVVDYSGSRRRPATSSEAEALPNRKVVAPVRLERALRASLGLEPWLDAFDELRVDGLVTTADLFD